MDINNSCHILPSSNLKSQPIITVNILLNCTCTTMVSFGDSKQKIKEM